MAALFIEGVALWAPLLPGWTAAAQALQLQGNSTAPTTAVTTTAVTTHAAPATAAPPQARPSPALLAANERRRAPDTVLVALEVASQALAHAGLALGADTADLASVFVSSHGDLPITDALCTTLAAHPLLLSPTRFHHSVHNAASGYWAIASGSQGPSTALSAHTYSLAAGLLEAASQCQAEQRRVLLVAYDTAACGGLASVNSSRGLLGVALLLAPCASPRARWGLRLSLSSGLPGPAQAGVAPSPAPALTLRSAAARALADNAMAAALPCFEALATGQPTHLVLPLSPGSHLHLELSPTPQAAEQAAEQAPAC